MTNITLLIDMIERYNALAYTHNYVFGFTFDGNVYAVTTGVEHLETILTLDRASRGDGTALRFSPTKAIKSFLFTAYKPVLICSEEFFNDTVKNSKYNKGEIFEKMYTEKCGQVWEKDNKKFTECGDIVVDGTHYQIKFQKATFTNEKTLTRLESKGR